MSKELSSFVRCTDLLKAEKPQLILLRSEEDMLDIHKLWEPVCFPPLHHGYGRRRRKGVRMNANTKIFASTSDRGHFSTGTCLKQYFQRADPGIAASDPRDQSATRFPYLGCSLAHHPF
jgi:hypothetical protein